MSMRMIERLDFILDKKEYNILKNYLNKGISFNSIMKNYNYYNLELIIAESNDYDDVLNIKVYDKNSKELYNAQSNDLDCLIGVIKVSDKDTDYYINIDIEYDKTRYVNYFNFYKEKLDIIIKNIGLNEDVAYPSMVYMDFNNKDQIVLAGFCLLSNLIFINKESREFDLFKNKLIFTGNDATVLSTPATASMKNTLSIRYVNKSVDNCSSHDKLIPIMISLISLIKKEYLLIKNNEDLKDLNQMVYDLTIKYFKLKYDDKVK